MLSINRRVTVAIILTACLAAMALAQQSSPRPEKPAVATPRAKIAVSPVKVEPAAEANQAPPARAATVSPSPALVRGALATSMESNATTVAARSVAPQQEPAIAEPQSKPVSATTPTPKSPDYVEEKGFKGRVFEVKYRDPDGLAVAIRPLGSGFKGATLSTNRDFRTITVRDFPENIASMEEAIKRLDVPEAPSPDIEFTVHVLIASQGEGSTSDLPAELLPVVKQLQSTLRYKNYNLMTSAIHRAREGFPNRVNNSGVAESKLLGMNTPQGNPIFFSYSFSRISLEGSNSATPRVQVGDFQYSMRVPLVVSGNDGKIQYEGVGFSTPVSMREGEKVVVGTTSMGDKGLVVVVSVKVIK